MKVDSLEKELTKLSSEVEYHNNKYYKEGNPIIDDRAFDELLGRVQALEKELGYSKPDSPTQKVGDDRLVGFKKVVHKTPMMSISNTYNISALEEYLHKIQLSLADYVDFVAEPKVDGIAISLVYEQGELKRAVTRGNGKEGDDVTCNIWAVRGIPHPISAGKSVLEVRGELCMDPDEFDLYNAKVKARGEEGFANARNACAGSIKQKDPKRVAERPLKFVAYTCLGSGMEFNTHTEELEVLDALGFDILTPIKVGQPKEISEVLETFTNKRGQYPFPTDGVVVRVNDISRYEELGTTSKSPKWMVAYKCEPDHAETKLLAVEWTVGRTGAITPTGVVEPTLLAGTLVSRASLHNYKNIKSLGLMIGDMVDLVKAGEIIPQIIRTFPDRRTGEETGIGLPKQCPSCGGCLNGDNVKLRCTNTHCPSRRFEGMVYFSSKPCMDIRGLGPSTVAHLINQGMLQDITDIYRLDEEKLRKAGLGKKEAVNLLEAIELSKDQDVCRVLKSLGIRCVGSYVAELLINKFGSISVIMDASLEQLRSLKSIGEIVAKYIRLFFDKSENRSMVMSLLELGLHDRREPLLADHGSPSLSVGVITGSHPSLPRRLLIGQLAKQGIRVEPRITKETGVLLVGENASSLKIQRAKSLGIPIKPLSDYS